MTEELKEEIRKLKEAESFYMDKFNKKYKHLVVEGFDGLEFENKQVIAFLDTFFESLLLVYPNLKVSQIKVKWGSCRFYSNLPMQLNFEIENHINELL